jgi:hypothetical protein
MKLFKPGFISILFLSLIGYAAQRLEAGAGAQADTAGGKIQLRVLYVGHPGGDREKDFVGFLNEHFSKVATGDQATYDGSQAKDSDVVVLDYDAAVSPAGPRAPQPKLPTDYARATVLMAVPGAELCGRLNLKPGYL